jgi:hypothetical protein
MPLCALSFGMPLMPVYALCHASHACVCLRMRFVMPLMPVYACVCALSCLSCLCMRLMLKYALLCAALLPPHRVLSTSTRVSSSRYSHTRLYNTWSSSTHTPSTQNIPCMPSTPCWTEAAKHLPDHSSTLHLPGRRIASCAACINHLVGHKPDHSSTTSVRPAECKLCLVHHPHN